MDGVKLYVGNLSYAVTNEQLKEFFTQYGEVNQANVIEGKGFGFVEMATSEGAEKAKTGAERHRLQRQGLEDRGSQAAEAQAAKQQGLRRQVLGRERAPHPAAHRACRRARLHYDRWALLKTGAGAATRPALSSVSLVSMRGR